MEEYIIKDGKKLRLGYTTGSCAAAAAKAACYMLLSGREKKNISLITPKGIELNLNVEEISIGEKSVSCAVRKFSGDDPDVTNGSLIFAELSLTEPSGIYIDGGLGVGRVTKPGLDQSLGMAAINSVPRKMIEENIQEVCKVFDYKGGLKVTISVPEGEELAKKTFNPRLGIIGGISILGTTGIVEPMSEQALVDTIKVELRQRRAEGREYALLAPGNYGSDYIKNELKLEPEKAVLSSNFIGDSLNICKELGFKGALLVGHIGKLIKLSGGMLNTHSKYGDCRMEIMAANAAAEGLSPQKTAEILDCVSCDEAVRILDTEGLREKTLSRISEKADFILKQHCGENFAVEIIAFSKLHGLLFKTEKADELLELIREGK